MDTKYKIHAGYILFILISIIIALATIKWSSIPSLVNYLSFAATVASLALAILAIVYSMYSNMQSAEATHTLKNSSHDISLTSIKLTQATAELTSQISNLPTLINNVEARVEATHSLLSEMSNSHNAITQTNVVSEHAASENSDSTTNFIKYSSMTGLSVLYSCLLAIEKNSGNLNLSDLSNRLEYFNLEYAWGYLVALSCFGILETERADSGAFNISKISPETATGIRTEINRRITTLNTDTISSLKVNIERLDIYFSENHA